MIGYEGLVWGKDKDGKEFICSKDNSRETPRRFEELSAHEESSCRNVNEIIGTEPQVSELI